MNEASDGIRDKSSDRQDGAKERTDTNNVGNSVPNVNENASRAYKMVENAGQKPFSDKPKTEKYNSDKKYDPRDRPPYKGINGFRPSPGGGGGRGRRDDDRRPSPNKQFRKDARGPINAGSYRKENDIKKSSDLGKPFVEESRLTKLSRRVQRETDRERKLILAKQLVDYLHTPEGSKFAARNGEEVLPLLKDVFFERGSKDVKNEVVYSVGLIGSLMGQDAHWYFNWLFGQVNSMIDDDVRSLFLEALLETLKFDEKKQLTADFTPLVLNHLQSLLENADTPQLLMSVVTVILQVTKVYPHIFRDYFRDTVDILVGWHIDSTQRDHVIEFTSTALISFQQFWVAYQSFTLELLGQFLEDMEAYAEDLSAMKQDRNKVSRTVTPDEVVKIGSLLKVFSTVIKSLGEDFDGNKSRLMTMSYFLEVFEKTVHAINSAMKCYFSECVMVTANECLFLLLNLVKDDVLSSRDTLLGYVTTVMFPAYSVRNKYASTALTLGRKVIELFGTQLPVPWLTHVLEPGSLLHSSKRCTSPEILKELTSVYQKLLGLKSIPLLEETYRHLLGDIQCGFNTLLVSTGDDHLLDLVPNNPYSNVVYTKHEAETTCVFCLCVLGEIGNTKNNLIGMWALSPSLFDLYCKHLDMVRPSISIQHPALQYAILQSLYAHSTRHGNFISTSSLFTQSTAREGSLLANVNPTTSANFTRLLKMLAELCTHCSTSYDCKLLALKWVSEIISSLHTSQHVYTTRQFLTLVQALYHIGYDQEEEVGTAVQSCLATLFKNPTAYPTYIVKGCMKLCMYRLSEGSSQLSQDYYSLLSLLPINVSASKNNGLYMLDEDMQLVCNDLTVGLPAVWQVCRSYSTRLPLGTFHSHNFRQVLGYLLHDTHVKQTGSLSWLESMYQSAQRVNSKPDWNTADGLIMQNYISRNVCVQWFWATWEASQFCVLTRLKTPLGKPQETFMSIEAVLKSFAIDAGSQYADDEGGDLKRKKNVDKEDTPERVRLLLQFMEHLEKQLYNAYEGAAASMPALPKAVRTFFRTNKNTCQEWLSRIRVFLLKITLHCGMYSSVVRHASEILLEMKETDNTQGCEFESVIQYLVQALCQLGEPDAIQGLYTWCKDVIGRKMSWMKAAIEKSYGRYEIAAKEYRSVVKSVLQEEDINYDGETKSARITGILGRSGADKSTGPSVALTSKLNMFVNEVCDCYVQLNDWESALEWQEAYTKLRADSMHNVPQAIYTVDLCFLKAMSAYDLNSVETVSEHLDLIPNLTNLAKWGLADREYMAESKLLQATATIQEYSSNNHKSEILKQLQESMAVCQSVLKIQSWDWPILVSPDLVSVLTTASTLKSHMNQSAGKIAVLPFSEKLSVDESDDKIHTFLQAIRTVRLQNIVSGYSNAELGDQLCKLQLAASSLARKQHNYNLAERLLLDQAGTLLHGHIEDHTEIDTVQAALKQLYTVTTLRKTDILRLERESAKLLHSVGDHRESVDILSKSVVSYACSDTARSALCNELSSRSLLTLVKWLQVDHKLLSSLAMKIGQGDCQNSMSQSLEVLLDLEEKSALRSHNLVITGTASDLKIGDNPIVTDTDRIVGKLLHLSTMQCESLPKSWYALASWCYKWGRKAVDNASHGSVQLFADEKSQILSLLPQSTCAEEREAVLNILGEIHSGMTSEEDISDQDQSQYDDGTETTRRQLLAASTGLQGTEEKIIDSLLDVWQGVVHRIYHYYQLSAIAYFKFLKLNGGNDLLKEENTEDCNVISTLRVLRLLVKHAWELRNVLEDGLAATPTAPWKGIIPQLFSRLSHPEAYVRQSISDLLCRVAEDAPHLIVYPAVVGSSTTKLDTKSETGVLNNYLDESTEGETAMDNAEDAASQDDDNLPAELEAESMLHNCILSMLNTLAANFPQMISDVKQLIEELRRITLLWDELWLGTLNQQHQDVERRIAQLENEIKKVDKNMALSKDEKCAIIKEKHKTVLKPTVYMMERLHEITSQPTATPHEKWFQDTYGLLISNALEKLRNPPNPSHPRASWHPFKQIHVSLQNKAQKRSSLVLTMDDISPKLHALRNTVIAMPGLGTAGQIVTIESVSNTVQILPTKTKPKKLVFKGSDGKRYPYLFKGLEDLHLDERIMQFLNIVNNMFASANKGSHELYRARHYSVTPLGPRSGLIQWVDGVTPLFALYKRWQQREASMQMLKQQAATGTNSTAPQPSIPRPSEVYYNKLTPQLKDKGIKDLDNRKDWPLSVQRKVLEELMAETPRDLLAKELWCTSTGPNEWWYVTQTYARSTAVMSMIGYIIGLGDRHLDNVLVDLATGEVVHIDYNVCFEKGKGLRVPERVPFRLTPNIEAALGITGIEGTFRLASEHVMKTLRKGRETLLTLLEAFVYDPLVDWTTGNEGGYTGAFYGGGLTTGTSALESRQGKLDMEREITTSMFSIRVAEMKVAWIQNRDEMVSVLPRIQGHLADRMQRLADYSSCMHGEEKFRELKQVVSEALGNSNSAMLTLHDRYKEYVVIKSTKDSVNKLVEEKISDCVTWQQMHKHVMIKLPSSAFQMCADIATSLNLGTPTFAAAKDFLQGAGQASVVQQCAQVETELTSSLQVQQTNLHRVIDVLHTYGTIVSQFGARFADNTRTSNYLHWLNELSLEFTENKCAEIVHQFHDMYGDSVSPQSKIQFVIGTELKLQNIIQDVNARLMKLVERRSEEKSEIRVLGLQVQESKAAIDDFVQENGESGVSSLTAVIVTALCALNKRNLQMEAAATGAGDRLMDLTSRDGDWFLEELCSMSGNVSQFLDMIKTCQQVDDGVHFSVLYKGMMSTHHVYTALQDLNVNFRTIILPEALKIIQGQEPSVFTLLSQLENILSEAGRPLDTIISQLEMLHRNAVMGIKTEKNELLMSVLAIRQRFVQLLEGGAGSDDLTPGQMLLMGFNGLFTRLDDEFVTLLECVDLMKVPDIWKKVDVIRDAKSLQLSSFTMDTRSLLSSLFFIRRLQVMQEFFHMCTQFAAAIQGLEGGNCYDDEQLSRPIKRFIADYVRKQIIGFPSQVLGYILCMTIHSMGLDVTAEVELKDIGAESKAPLDEICKKAVDMCMKNSQFQQVHFTQASTLTSGQDASWRRHDLTRRLDSNIDLLKGGLHRAQLHVTRLHWLHEDMFIQAGRQPSHMIVANRSTIMSEIKKCMQALVSQESSLVSCQTQYTQLESSITQRLKWAAGANPSLNLILQQFEESSVLRKQLAEDESKHSQEVINLCQGILHLEALRTRTPEAMASDTNFLSLINKCNESCVMVSSSNCSVTEAEAELMKIKPLEEDQKTDAAWLKSAMKEIKARLQDTDKKIMTFKTSIDEAKDGIKGEVNNIKTMLATHHKLMSDIRAILKSLAKQEEQEYGEQVNENGIRDYLNLYKKFSENLTMALKMIVSDDFTAESMLETKSIIDALHKQIPQIYVDLVALAPPLICNRDASRNTSPLSFATAVKRPMCADDSQVRRPSLLHNNHVSGTPPTGSLQIMGQFNKSTVSTPVKKSEKITRDPKTGKAIQERNSYAVGVWRRVKMKLDGRDPDQNKRLSAAEQVDYVIKDATSLDNLAMLYEGWTPWV